MRIALLSWESLHSVTVGGVGVHVSELSQMLARKGHQIHIFTRRLPHQRAHDEIEGVHYHRCFYPSSHDFVDEVNQMCRAFVDRVFEVEDFVGHFDIIHAHDWLTANAMIWIKQGRGHRCVLTIHSTEYGRCGNIHAQGRSERVRAQERAGTYWADRVITVSGVTQREIMDMYEVPESKTSVIYNGVFPQRFALTTDPGEDKRHYGLGPLDPTVLFCGRLAWQKGPDLLVEAVPTLLRRYGHAKFLMVGDGEMRPSLEARIRQLGIHDAVRLLGYRQGEELVRLFRLADVVCVPSRNEPFGIVVLEAWSAGKPVVVTQNGGPNEYVQHETNGLKIYAYPHSVVWGVDRIFSNFDHARWMGENGRKTIDNKFTWDIIADQILALYRELCPAALQLARQQGQVVPPDHPIPEIPMQMQVRLQIKARQYPDPSKDIWGPFKTASAHKALRLQQYDHALTLKGHWETVLQVLQKAQQTLQQNPIRLEPDQLPAAIPIETVRSREVVGVVEPSGR